jgi:hypothetical protein
MTRDASVEAFYEPPSGIDDHGTGIILRSEDRQEKELYEGHRIPPRAGGPVSHPEEEDHVRGETGPAGPPRYSRRLSDKILIAFHHACDQADFEVAEQLLHVLEMMLTRRPLTPDGTRRRNMESLVAAHERLWHLRHPNVDGL